MRSIPARARGFIVMVAILATTVAVSLARVQPDLDLGVAASFALLFVLAELAPVPTRHGGWQSVSFVIVVAAIAVAGPLEATISAAFASFSPTLRHGDSRMARLVFNASQYVAATGTAAVVYRALGGPARLDIGGLPSALLPLVVASIVFYVVNEWMVLQMVALVQRIGIGEVMWQGNITARAATMTTFGVLGVILAVLYLLMGFLGIVFMLVPLLTARRALQAASDMDAAYESTLSSLVTAIEAKDAYTRGHAERVSRLTAMIARELGLPELHVRTLRYAALMHDIGKLVVSTKVLTKPGKLTDDEYEHMKRHPILGCEVIAEIDFLRDGEAVNAVRHHHERLDGRGYPDALSGDDVPLTARIVMVADAFDSMTSTRSYRPASLVEKAMTELRRCAATQFDPQMIDALDRAVRRHGWEPSPEAFLGEQTARPATSVHASHEASS